MSPKNNQKIKKENFLKKVLSVMLALALVVGVLPSILKVVDDPLESGEKVLWGNEGNELANQLIFKADLSAVGSATLKFDNYIEIEEQWDFGMVQVSTDNGETWASLSNGNTRSDIVDEGYPAIRENLPGFTGYYDDWNKESLALMKLKVYMLNMLYLL